MTKQPRTRTERLTSERGAILIQVGVAVLVLSAFAMFVVDYGVLWVSRHQAQNAADAGALAGAVALAFDDAADHSDTGPAKLAAHSFAQSNMVWGQAPAVDITTDVRFYADDPGAFPAECAGNDCIRVDVYRNQTKENPLPMIFGWIVDLGEQGVRATATARAAVANASDCIKPWALADKWAEHNPVPNSTWSISSTFNPTGATPDVYIPQNGVDSPGTSFTLNDVGTEMTLKLGKPGDSMADMTPGWFQALDLPCEAGNQGAACYEDNIVGCTTATYEVDDPDLPKENGAMAGKTRSGTEALIALDPDAKWDPIKKEVYDSCVEPPYSCSKPGYKQSPRIVAIPVFDTQEYYDTGGPGQGTIHVRQILGFFVDRLEGKGGNKSVVGFLAKMGGLLTSTGGSVAPGAAFLTTVQLVR
jgi:Flp pilus assembly protein TadG